MIADGYRYRFLSPEALRRAEWTLRLATLAAEGLHGEGKVRMDAQWLVDEERNVIVVDGATAVGSDISRIFTAFLTKVLGPNKFLVGRISGEDRP